MLDQALETAGSFARAFLLYGSAVLLVGVLAHTLTWLFFRRGRAGWVWGYWNVLGIVLLVAGTLAIGYGWLVVGLHTPAGSALTGLGLLLASAGLWMLIPV
jgi:hypothetical protein